MPPIDPRDWTPEHEERLRAALQAEADAVRTDPAALAAIRRRTAKPPLWRSPALVGVLGATAVAGALVVGTLVVLNQPSDDPVADEGTSPTVLEPTDTQAEPEPSGGVGEGVPTAPPEDEAPEPLESPADEPSASQSSEPDGEITARFEGTVPVYYAAPAPTGQLRLTREFHHVDTTEDPVQIAVKQMFAEQPDDPDYVSLWQPAEVSSVEVTDDAIVVDLADVPAVDVPEPDTPTIEAAVQQLVYTATAAAANSNQTDGSKPVRVLVNGERPDALYEVGLHQDLSRTSQITIRQLVQINDPAEGAEVTSPLAVSGEAAAFEAALVWEVRDDAGEVVDSGTAQAAECCTFAPFDFTVELEPGAYTLSVSDTDPSAGEGGGPVTDSKTFRVEESSNASTPDPAPTAPPTED